MPIGVFAFWAACPASMRRGMAIMATRLHIAQSERALLWRQGRFVGILEPGVRWVVQPFACIAVQLYDLRVPEFVRGCSEQVAVEEGDIGPHPRPEPAKPVLIERGEGRAGGEGAERLV